MKFYFEVLLLFGIFFMLQSCGREENKSAGNLSRVETAYFEKQEKLYDLLEQKTIDPQKLTIFLRAFKTEELLEVWAKNKAATKFQKILSYDFCKSSGQLGPKRREGDLQIPEGVYHINRFNPHSNFYLSLGLNYPNPSDKIRGDQKRPGSDIFIHGACVTVGCIPITDEKIKDLYVLADLAKKSGQEKIPVHIFPAALGAENLEKITNQHGVHTSFWKELRVIYDAFERNLTVPNVSIDANGVYGLENSSYFSPS